MKAQLFTLMMIVLLFGTAACGGNESAPSADAELTQEETHSDDQSQKDGASQTEADHEKQTEVEDSKEAINEETVTEETMPEETVTETNERCGDTTQLSESINMFNWGDYMDDDILTQFAEECGVKVVQDIFSTNEDMIAKIQAGNSGYDIVVPSDYAVDIMIKNNLLAELNKENIPNITNLNPNQMGLYYDPENKYSLPYQLGTTGIAYNTQYFDTPPDSWAVLFETEQVCEHSGFVSMLDDERESIGAVLKYLGYSYNDTDPAHQEEAKALLLAQKECLAGYNSDNFNQTLAAEEIVIAHAWSGGAALARAENENIAFVIPKEGGAIWMDNVAIPIDAPNQYTAEIFINYLLEAEIGGQLTNYIYYFTPNKAAEAYLDEEYFQILESGGMTLQDTDYERLDWIKRDENSIIFSDTWTAIKAQ